MFWQLGEVELILFLPIVSFDQYHNRILRNIPVCPVTGDPSFTLTEIEDKCEIDSWQIPNFAKPGCLSG